jgi:DNA-binding LacI/PurR family transcriptional regulator
MKGVHRPTMADVARAAGVSPTTVSHALNGKGRVDETTRARVRETARRLGYAPSRAARNLALGRSDTLGVVLPQVASLPSPELFDADWYGRIVVGASRAAVDHSRAMTLLPGLDTVEDVRRHALEGAIVLDPIIRDPRCSLLGAAGIPYVMVGSHDGNALGVSVTPDTAAGVTALLDHVEAQGACSIALLATDIDWSSGHEAIEAYRAWMRARDQFPRISVARMTGSAAREHISRAAFDTARELLSGDERPDAIIGLYEHFGRAIIDAAEAVRLRVPEDVLVAQDVDGPKAQLNRPAITALDLNPVAQITTAVEQLIALVQGDEPVRRLTTPVTLHERATTGRVTRPRSV